MIKINGTENDMEDGTEILYAETNQRKLKMSFTWKMNRRIYYAKISSTSLFIRITHSLFSAL